jgi:hypothetical protein
MCCSVLDYTWNPARDTIFGHAHQSSSAPRAQLTELPLVAATGLPNARDTMFNNCNIQNKHTHLVAAGLQIKLTTGLPVFRSDYNLEESNLLLDYDNPVCKSL